MTATVEMAMISVQLVARIVYYKSDGLPSPEKLDASSSVPAQARTPMAADASAWRGQWHRWQRAHRVQ